jgi:hypothetical protein
MLIEEVRTHEVVFEPFIRLCLVFRGAFARLALSEGAKAI